MKNNKIIPIGIITLCLGLILALVLSPKLMKNTQLDPITGCEANIPRRTVILLDHSESVSAQTKNEIFTRAMRTANDKAMDGELISVFYASSLSKKNLSPIFSYCKPKIEANTFTESERIVKNTYKDKFLLPLQNAIKADILGSDESPITQAIVDLSLIDQLRSSQPAQLIIFSDLWEHTQKFSLYKCNDPRYAIAAYRESRGANTARPSFKNVSIELNVVPRDNKNLISKQCRDSFWLWFLGDNEGSYSSLNKIDLPG